MLLSPNTSNHRSRMPLISIMGEVHYQTSTPSESSEFITTIAHSRLFTLLCFSLQVTIVVAASLVFYVDAYSIGYDRGRNWRLVTIAVVLYTFSSWFIIAVLGPCSRLGKKVIW